MTKTILPTNTKKQQPRVVSRELNFDLGQFFYPQEKRKIFDIRQFSSEIINEEGEKQLIQAVVKPDATLGTLTTFDERVFYVLIEIWEEQKKQQKVYFSEREIARRMEVTFGRQTEKALRESLERLRGVVIRWEDSFYVASEKHYERINPFTIINHLDIKSNKRKPINNQVSTFGFDDRIIENLNSNYSRPIRFDVILSFKSPLAQSLYTLFDRQLYGTKRYHRTTKGLLIDDLGLIGSTYQQRKNRIQYLNRVRDELLNVPTSSGEIIEKYEIDTNRKDDAVITVERSGVKRIKGQLFFIPSSQTENQPTPEKLPKKPSQPKENPQAKEVLDYFQKVFFKDSATSHHTDSALKKASELLNKESLDTLKFLINFAHREAPKTNYQPRTFNGIVQYLPDALKALKKQEIQQKRQQEQAQKIANTRLENARCDHEKVHRNEYINYVQTLVENLPKTHPEDFQEFERFEEQERLEQIQTNNKELRQKLESFFDAPHWRAIRLVKFFKDHPQIKIRDFWEWDSRHNPKPFQDS